TAKRKQGGRNSWRLANTSTGQQLGEKILMILFHIPACSKTIAPAGKTTTQHQNNTLSSQHHKKLHRSPSHKPMDILIIAGLILLNGLFAMAEIALISARQIRLQ